MKDDKQVTQEEHENKLVNHLDRIINNLNQHWHSIQLLLQCVSKPLIVDDRGLAQVLGALTEKLKEITSSIEHLDLTQTFGEIKYIGNRLKDIEASISQIKEEGFKKNIELNLSCDGYELVKKKNKSEIVREEEKADPEEAVKALLLTLTSREYCVVIHRIGLLGEKKKTYDAIGKLFGITRERGRQIYCKALRKCRHPTRAYLADNITHKELRKEIGGE
jgi:hypothetical protein